MDKLKFAGFLFLLFSTLDIAGIVFKIPMLVLVSKTFIIPALLFLYSVSVSKLNKWYVFALIFSFLGDVFLMFNGEIYFIIGLVSFLTAHLFFMKIVLKRIQKSTLSAVLISIIPFGALFLLLIFIIKDSVGTLLFPVIIYGLVISSFGTLSLIDYRKTNSKIALFMLIGAIVFMLSDSLLAINKFYLPLEIFGVLVMATYIVAQYLIYRSMILETEKSSN